MLHISAAYSYMKMDNNLASRFFDMEGIENVDLALNLSSVDLMAEIYPFGPVSSFSVTAGLHFMTNNLFEISGQITGSGDILGVQVESLGAGSPSSITLEANKIAPYLGIGFGRAVPKRRVGLGVKLGVFVLGKEPKLTFTSSNLTRSVDEIEADLQKEINDNFPSILPSLNVRVMFKLKG